MKGVILAGGKGTRLYPLTKATNKILLPVYNKPMVYYPIETLVKAGIKDIIIVCAKEHAGNFINLLGSGKGLGAKIEYTVQEEPKGIAHALALAEDFVDGDGVMLNLGDNILFDDLSGYVRGFDDGAMVFLKRVRDGRNFGVPVFEGKRIVRIEEKPSNPKSSYAVTGLYIYDGSVFDKIRRMRPSKRGELEITDLNNMYIKEGRLDYGFLKGPWSDAGTFEGLFETARMVRERDIKSIRRSGH